MLPVGTKDRNRNIIYLLFFRQIKWSCRMQHGLLSVIKHLADVFQRFGGTLKNKS
jgi:hypothetical protein